MEQRAMWGEPLVNKAGGSQDLGICRAPGYPHFPRPSALSPAQEGWLLYPEKGGVGKCSGAGLCRGWGSREAVREAGRAHVSA